MIVCTSPHLKWRTSGTLVGGDALSPGTLAALRVPGYGRVSSLRDEVSYNCSLAAFLRQCRGEWNCG